MQVARLLHPHSRTLFGKTQQLLRTLQLEWQLSKKEILELYLNIAPFGGTIEGVEAASFTYLNKSANELTHAEAALLAVLPQAPTRFRPDLHNGAAQKARNKVLKRMLDFGLWSKEVVNDAMLEQVFSFNFRPKQLAPLLSRRLLAYSTGQQAVESTIDSDLQQNLQALVASYINRLPERSSAAILVVDNETLAVKAYIGSADFANDKRFGYLDMVQATRSPGSTLKPFLYGLALDDGLIHSHSLLADVPRSWGSYRPENFSGAFSGPVSATEALQRSLNMPAVDLLERYGVNRFVARLENAGLSLSIPNNQPNLAIILGGVGSTLEQLVQSYAALANQGKTAKLVYLQDDLPSNVKNGSNASHKQSPPKRQLLSKESAWLIKNILSEIDRPNSLNTFSSTRSQNNLAWKTGTSYGYRDSWAIGVNDKYTLGVWLGRPDGSAMPGHFGRITAGPLLFSVADRLSNTVQKNDRLSDKPQNITEQTICWPLGTVKTDENANYCQQTHKAWLIDEVAPPTWHVSEQDAWQSNLFTFWLNPKNNKRVSMDCAIDNKVVKKVTLWPAVLEPWLKNKYRRVQQIPALDNHCKNTAMPLAASLNIIGIENNSIYRKAGKNAQLPSLSLKTIGGSGIKSWYINGKLLYQIPDGQHKEHLLTKAGTQQIVVQDERGNTDMVLVEVLF
jgi:penicillin-binding protein 1C